MARVSGNVRKVDNLGRVTLPMEIRRFLDIEEGDDLQVLLDEKNGGIILKKAIKQCLKCKSTQNLTEVKPGCFLCSACIAGLKAK